MYCVRRDYRIHMVSSAPYLGQMPGTSGLRKSFRTFSLPNYTENFIQSVFDYYGDKLEGSTIIVGGDGRNCSLEVAEVIVRMSAANRIGNLIIGQNAMLSFPALSNMVRKHKAICGIMLLGLHKSAGETGHDFGIFLTSSHGGPAKSSITDQIYTITTKINSFIVVPDLQFDLSIIGSTVYRIEDEWSFELRVVDSIADYVSLLRSIFDFTALRSLLAGTDKRRPFNVVIDCMNSITGPYVKAVLEELDAPLQSVINAEPQKVFSNADQENIDIFTSTELVKKLSKGFYDFGMIYDADGDRHIVFGEKGFLINAGDSLAVLSSHINCVPYFKKYGIRGVARSMPTSRALDRVAKDCNWPLHVVPTGWKYFSNLLDSGRITICGEESFGVGSRHVRVCDGLWAALAWLSVANHMFMSIQDIVCLHWAKYGRFYFLRHDYNEMDEWTADKIIISIFPRIESAQPKMSWRFETKNGYDKVSVAGCSDFTYTDPVDKTTVKNQGYVIMLTNDSRIVIRKNATDYKGTTLRIYLERPLPSEMWLYPLDTVMEPLIKVYKELTLIEHFTGKLVPDSVIV